MPGFHLRRGSEVTGPHDAASLRAMAAHGELHADDEVSSDGRTWRRLRDVRGFPAAAPSGAPVDAPGSAAADADPITLGEVAAPVWAALRRAGKAVATAAVQAAGAAADAAKSTREAARRADESRRRATIVWRSDEPIELPAPIRTPLGMSSKSLTIWVVITYAIRSGRIVVTQVRQATSKECGQTFNVAANDVGEAFTCHIQFDQATAARIFASSYSTDMRRKMLGAWKARYGRVEKLGSPDDRPVIGWDTMPGQTETVRWLMDTHIKLPRTIELQDGQRVRNASPLVDIEYTADAKGLLVLAVSLVRTERDPDAECSTDGEPNMAAYPSGDMFRYTGRVNQQDLVDAARHEAETSERLQQVMRERWEIMRPDHRAGGSRTPD